jgi:hypothetical protein
MRYRLLDEVLRSHTLAEGDRVAYATIPDSSSGVIHGCYTKTTGALRVIDPSKGQSCASGEASLNWNQSGIRWRGAWKSTTTYAVNDAVSANGQSYIAVVKNTNSAPPGVDWALLAKKGGTGVQGPPGGQGPPGVSAGVSTVSGTSVPLNTAQSLVTVMTTPAVATGGEYYVNASAMLVVGSGDTVACIAEVNGSATGPFATVGPVPNPTYETLPLAVSIGVPAGGTISVACSGYTANATTLFYDGGITATLIDSDNASAAAEHAAARPPALPRAPGASGR